MTRPSQCTFEPGDEPKRCCAKAKSTQLRCGNPVVPRRRVCRIHGGLAGVLPKHGRYSKGLGRFREAYEESLQDSSLLDLRETLALMDVVVHRAAERAADADMPNFRIRALELFEKARGTADPQEAAAGLNRLGELLRCGVKDDEALDGLARAAERLARRQEKAWSIKLDASVALNARDLLAIMARWADIVMEEASRDEAARIIRRIDGEVLGDSHRQARLET